MLNKNKRFLFLAVLLYALVPSQTYTRGGSSSNASGDALGSINYKNAFNQEELYTKFENLMWALGCHGNVFDVGADLNIAGLNSTSVNNARLNVINNNNNNDENCAVTMTDEQIAKSRQKYAEACLFQLKKARRSAIMSPAYESLSLMALVGLAAAAVDRLTRKDTIGNSFSVFSAVNNAVFLFADVIRSGVNYVYLPTHPLNMFEEFFAKNKCFIPRELWPIIVEKFTLARQNQFEQRNAMNFIEFSLGFTTYQKPLQSSVDRIKVELVIHEINSRIDAFFAGYNDETNGEYRGLLKINIAKFILALTGNSDESPRYIYLHGPGGIGKTHFVGMLAQWIQELLPDMICFNDLVITSERELEGTPEKPGAMLRILRNQLIGKKRGSLVFMDEATWLNKGDMISCAKRVFNGNQSKLSTSYFGSGMDGTGVDLKLPPTLIFVASNEDITDPALASRFDTIKFPTPQAASLASSAMNVIKRSKVLVENQAQNQDILQEDLLLWIKENEIKNFRAVASKVEQHMLSKSTV